jgi:hypothetical protein
MKTKSIVVLLSCLSLLTAGKCAFAGSTQGMQGTQGFQGTTKAVGPTENVHQQLVSTLLELQGTNPTAAKQFIDDLSYEDLQAMGLDIQGVDMEELKFGLKKAIDESPDFRKNAKTVAPKGTVKILNGKAVFVSSDKKLIGKSEVSPLLKGEASESESSGQSDEEGAGGFSLMGTGGAEPLEDGSVSDEGAPVPGSPDVGFVENKSEKVAEKTGNVTEKVEKVADKAAKIAEKTDKVEKVVEKVEKIEKAEKVKEKADEKSDKLEALEKLRKVNERDTKLEAADDAAEDEAVVGPASLSVTP